MKEAASKAFEMETVPSSVEILDEDTRSKLVALPFTTFSQTMKSAASNCMEQILLLD